MRVKIEAIKNLLDKEHYENYAVSDYRTFPQCVNTKKIDLVQENYNNIYNSYKSEGKPQLLINPISCSAGTCKMAAKKIRENKYAECSNFAAGAAGTLLSAMEDGSLAAYDITLAGISNRQNHNIAIVSPRGESDVGWKDKIIIDPWAFALGHGNSCVYTYDNYPFITMLKEKINPIYQSAKDEKHTAALAEVQTAQTTDDVEEEVITATSSAQYTVSSSQKLIGYDSLFAAGAVVLGIIIMALDAESYVKTAVVAVAVAVVGLKACSMFSNSAKNDDSSGAVVLTNSNNPG